MCKHCAGDVLVNKIKKDMIPALVQIVHLVVKCSVSWSFSFSKLIFDSKSSSWEELTS